MFKKRKAKKAAKARQMRRAEVMGIEMNGGIRKSFIVVALLVILFVTSGFYAGGGLDQFRERIPSTHLESSYIDRGQIINDPCDDRDFCLAVYLDPTDSQSKRSAPFIKKLRRYHASFEAVGLKIIIGDGPNLDQNNLADKIGGEVFFDTAGAFGEKLRLKKKPAWVVSDSNSFVVKKTAGFPGTDTYREAIEWWLGDVLKIELDTDNA